MNEQEERKKNGTERRGERLNETLVNNGAEGE